MTDPRNGCPERELEPPESEICTYCAVCGEPIFRGEGCYRFFYDGKWVHEDCLDEYLRLHYKTLAD